MQASYSRGKAPFPRLAAEVLDSIPETGAADSAYKGVASSELARPERFELPTPGFVGRSMPAARLPSCAKSRFLGAPLRTDMHGRNILLHLHCTCRRIEHGTCHGLPAAKAHR